MSKECNLDKYVKHVRTAEQIATRFTNFGMLVVGDYNLPGVNWHLNDDIFYDTRYALLIVNIKITRSLVWFF